MKNQVKTQVRNQFDRAKYTRGAVGVYLRRVPGLGTWASMIGAAISFSIIDVSGNAGRWRLLKVFVDGKEVSKQDWPRVIRPKYLRPGVKT